MVDEAGAAPAAAEPIATPTEPSGQPSEPEQIDRASEPARASIDRAFAAMDKQDGDPAERPEAKAETAAEQRARDEATGRFKAKEAAAGQPPAPVAPDPAAAAPKPVAVVGEPPARFSADAKATWATAPEPVKAEAVRAIKELEAGIQQHQAVLAPLKPYMDLAKQHGTTVHEAMDRYTGLERALLSQDPQHKLAALQEVFETAGISPRDYAAHIMGQPADKVASQSDATIRELRRENADLKQQVGGMTATMQERVEQEVKSEVMGFYENNPRMNDEKFANKVARLIKIGVAENLQEAYDMADGLIPAPAAGDPSTASTAATTKPGPDQTRKASLQIAGAPASGSNPVNRKTPASARESLDRSFATLGIG